MITCRICGTKYEGDTLVDECPLCDWVESFTGEGEEDDYDEVNHMTPNDAKANYAKGLNIWGEPLPKIRSSAK